MTRHILLSLFLLLGLVACEEGPAPQTTSSPEPIPQAQSPSLEPALANAIRELMASYLNRIDIALADTSNDFQQFETQVNAFLQQPTDAEFTALREAWLQLHSSYESTLLHRYFASEALDEQQTLNFFEVQYRLDHWPILPGYIDYVGDYPYSGIVNDMTVPLEANVLRDQHGEFDIHEASIGFHVLEFMLWGENAEAEEGAGLRPYTDYLPATTLTSEQAADGLLLHQLSPNRRRELLALNTRLLEEDFQSLVNIWSSNSIAYLADIDSASAEALLLDLLNAITALLSEELLVRSLYPMLNGEFAEGLPSLYSRSSPATVSAQLSGLENLLQEISSDSGTNFDTVLSALSEDFEEFFYQNFDASKECLVVLYATDQISQSAQGSADTEFKVVECINFLTNMIDYVEQIKGALLAGNP